MFNIKYHNKIRRLKTPAGRRVVVGVVLGWAAVGCNGTETDDVVPSRPEPAVAPSAAEPTIAVFLTEYTIDMPARIDAGETRISVTNQGVEDHNLKIQRAGSDEILWQTDGNVGTGLTQEGVIDLSPGEYVVVCDFAGHDSRGMFLTLEVGDR